MAGIATYQSPNHDPRPGGAAIDMVVLHYSGMETADAALARLCDPAAKVSAHYLIGEDGAIRRLVAEDAFEGDAFESIRVQHMGAGAADPYQVLGLSSDATDAEVKAAYRKRSREYHPDTLIGQGLPL